MADKPTGGAVDFIGMINDLGKLPDPGAGSGVGGDLPDGFPVQDREGIWKRVDTSKDPEAIPGAVESFLLPKREYFTVYRPWEQCQRCKDDLAQQMVELPEEGDLTCPHTNKRSLDAIYLKAAKGRALINHEEQIVQKDGTVVVSIVWGEMRDDVKKRKKVGGQQDEPAI